MEKYLEIGKIANTHGVKGELKVLPLTDDPERFEELEWVYIDRVNKPEKFNIEGVKYFKNFVILKFKDINDMTLAESMKGLYIKIDRENAIKLPKDSFFICDLIDCEVFNEKGEKLGKLNDIIHTGSNDVYVVKNKENNTEILIPALKSVVKSVSVENKKITVELPEGLTDNEV
jgi:16S rRNA processing protein RimM